MNAHDFVVKAILQALPQDAELRLLGRLSDTKLGNSSRKEVFFFIPDLHLISAHRKERFGKYGFNYEDSILLGNILKSLLKLKTFWDRKGDHKLVTVQLGDFFDLWREFGGTADVTQIADDTHQELRDLLYRNVHRGRACLKATMLIGNHDTKRGIPLGEIGFQLRAFNRGEQPFLFVSHGDAFDTLEKLLPDPIQEFVVHFIGALTPVNKYTVGPWGQEVSKLNKNLGDLDKCIMAEKHDIQCEVAPVVTPGAKLPARMVTKVTKPKQEKAKRFRDYWQSFRAAEARFPSAKKLRAAVVGHSHQAGMLWSDGADGKPPMLLMDVGAWIERCSYPISDNRRAENEPSAQLGVIHGNDARIYQVHFKQYEVP